jgi:hypothetical protein
MRVKHLDEAYLYTFGQANEQEIAQFAHNLLSPDEFFTESGPTIIAKRNNYGYTSAEYHGVVVWAKQAAFAVIALSKFRKEAVKQSWKAATRNLIDRALEETCARTLHAFLELHAVPELHYDREGKAHFFTDQVVLSGGMSKVQLWSAIGFRRIVRSYHDYLAQKR